MRSCHFTLAAAVLLPLAFATSGAQAATWGASSPATSSCSASNLFATWSFGSYGFSNDVWGPCGGTAVGPQTIWANSNVDWGVWSDQPNTGGIKSYPHIGYTVNRTISSLSALTTTGSASTPSGGAWESTFDVWVGNNAHEIMLWLNYTGTSAGCGNVKPVSYNWTSGGCAIPVYTNVSVGGGTWNVYRGNNGSNMVYSLLRTSKTNSTAVDVLAILKYLKNLGWFGDLAVGDVQYGFEITSSSGGMNFGSSNFTVTAR
jgi:xyloglucan-specific endo-beta-1,4-glucanase